MQLDPAGVEKAAQNLMVHMGCEPIEDDWRACVAKHCSCRKAAEAALTAYFDHLKSEGLMREAGGTTWNHGELWEARENATFFVNGFPALIIKQEE